LERHYAVFGRQGHPKGVNDNAHCPVHVGCIGIAIGIAIAIENTATSKPHPATNPDSFT
jgi:hypothetical protein